MKVDRQKKITTYTQRVISDEPSLEIFGTHLV